MNTILKILLILLPLFSLGCKTRQALVKENEMLRKLVVEQNDLLQKIKVKSTQTNNLINELKINFNELQSRLDYLENENNELKIALTSAEEKLQISQKPQIGSLSIMGKDTTHRSGKYYTDNNKIGEFQIFQLKFSIFPNPAIKDIVEDTVWLSMEDSLHHEIPIRLLSKNAIVKGNSLGIEIITDGELHYLQRYFVTETHAKLKAGFYKFSLSSNGRTADIVSIKLE